ncbi:hypothetical protein AGMMS50230_11200 [Spirochaetia bacterium]|nr:hypothetical protein AGMMS50230_11200 [Spirochaetia bacterium]
MNLSFINVDYNFLKDNPKYDPAITDTKYDPDTSSEILQIYHKLLWSKEENNIKLYFNRGLEYSDLILINRYTTKEEENVFSSDWIVNDYQHWDRNKYHELKYLDNMDINILKNFNNITNTIGGRIIFPKRKIDGKDSINVHRGRYRKICDRFDITLECIRRFYSGIESIPEFDETLKRYSFFFLLFGKHIEGFKNYCNFFFLQDLVLDDYTGINFFIDFKEFENNPFPKSEKQYLLFVNRATNFIKCRNKRMLEYIKNNIDNVYD